MGDHAFQFLGGDAIIQRPLQMAFEFRCPIQRGEHRASDQTAVTFGQLGLLPNIAEQHFVAQFSELRDHLINGFLSHFRFLR